MTASMAMDACVPEADAQGVCTDACGHGLIRQGGKENGMLPWWA